MTDTALLIATIADLIGDAGHVCTGALSPVPMAAALLAQRRSAGRMRVTALGSRRHNRFTDGGKELFDCAAQGRIDVFFLSGVQIDGEANINLVGLGDPDRPSLRFGGSFGSPYLYMLVPRVILFRPAHDRRALVRRVDYVSAPGWSPPGVYRPGGPQALVTGRCVFNWQSERRRFALRSAHPGETADTIRGATGFHYDEPDQVPTTPPPDAATRAEIAAIVREEVAETYPRFAEEFRA